MHKDTNSLLIDKKGSLRISESLAGRLVYRQNRRIRRAARNVSTGPSPSLLNLNTICPYYTMFPLDFPLGRLANAKDNDWVLDPFCGRGTTLFAARLLGLGCVGVDSNPIAAAIAAAKLADTSIDAVIETARSILTRVAMPRRLPKGEFWELCFHRGTLRDICILREELNRKCSTSEEIVLRALILGILHGPYQKGNSAYLSNQMPRTYATKPAAAVRFWKRKGKTSPPQVNVLAAIQRRSYHTLSELPPPAKGAVYFGDARSIETLLPRRRRFNWVITSPPYLGMRTYRPDQWLRNWFLGGEDHVEYVQDGQLSHRSERFTEDLSVIWRAVGKRCAPGARLIVRFGYLPSVPIDAYEVLRNSLKLADAGWRICGWVNAGSASNGMRQSEQFGGADRTAAEEVDVYARLEV